MEKTSFPRALAQALCRRQASQHHNSGRSRWILFCDTSALAKLFIDEERSGQMLEAAQ